MTFTLLVSDLSLACVHRASSLSVACVLLFFCAFSPVKCVGACYLCAPRVLFEPARACDFCLMCVFVLACMCVCDIILRASCGCKFCVLLVDAIFVCSLWVNFACF